jgi:hypothetical protein
VLLLVTMTVDSATKETAANALEIFRIFGEGRNKVILQQTV